MLRLLLEGSVHELLQFWVQAPSEARQAWGLSLELRGEELGPWGRLGGA